MTQQPAVRTEHSHSEAIVFSGTDRVILDHFPGNPIVPAFMQLARVRQVASRVFGVTQSGVRVKSVKFTRLLRPDRSVILTFATRENIGTYRFSIFDGDEVATQGEFVL